MKRDNQFWYFYILIAMMAIQFLALLYLIGDVSSELSYLRASVNQLRAPTRNEVVTVVFGLGDKYTGSRVINPTDHEDMTKETKLLTVFGGKLYEMITPVREVQECDSNIK